MFSVSSKSWFEINEEEERQLNAQKKKKTFASLFKNGSIKMETNTKVTPTPEVKVSQKLVSPKIESVKQIVEEDKNDVCSRCGNHKSPQYKYCTKCAFCPKCGKHKCAFYEFCYDCGKNHN